MSEALDFEDDVDPVGDEPVEAYDVVVNLQRHDVRRKIEERMELRRLREEFGEFDV